MSLDPSRLIWVDLEMTGLDPQTDRILEIATVVTDRDLEILAEGPVLALQPPEEALARMDEWNRHQHSGSGLLARVRVSTVSETEAERLTLSFLAEHAPFRSSPMCGNSVCQDRRFLAQWMPELERYFHYRNLDVSTLKELALRWAPSVAAGLTKKGTHLALEDIRESIAELRYYRQHLLRC